ncbi:hypothetical protein [Nocardia vinacea]|nr:hypothetical protein [Nocardia vinacea]
MPAFVLAALPTRDQGHGSAGLGDIVVAVSDDVLLPDGRRATTH